MIEINVTKPDLDWDAFDAEDLVTAVLIQDPTTDADGKTVHFDVDAADKAEEKLRNRLDGDQKFRRDEHLKESAEEAISAFSKNLSKSYSNINVNIGKLLDTATNAQKAAARVKVPDANTIRDAQLAAARIVAKNYARNQGVPKRTNQRVSKSANQSAVELPISSALDSPIQDLESAMQPLMSIMEGQADILATISSAMVDSRDSLRRQVRHAETEIANSKKRERNSYWFTGASLLVALSSLLVAIYRPLTIDAPNQPIPVQIIEPEAPNAKPMPD